MSAHGVDESLDQDSVKTYRYGHADMSPEELTALSIKQGAPQSIEDLVEDWSSRIEMLARKYGFKGAEVEDAKSMIFLQFFEGNYLDIYDPRVAVFSTFMYNFIQRRMLQLVSKKQRDPIANYVPLAATSDNSTEGAGGEMFMDMLDPGSRTMEEVFESTSVIQEIRRRLSSMPQRGKRNLAALFDMLILDYPRSEMARALGVSEATVCLMIKDLRNTNAIKMLRWK